MELNPKRKIMEFSNLPRDLVEEISSKLPVKSLRFSLRAMQLTCKNWSESFREKHIISEEEASRESMVMMLINHKVYLMDFNLHGIHNNVDPSIRRKGKLVTLNGYDQVADISQIFHCDGLLLCITNDEHENKKLVVWNPYSGETRWIKPTNYPHMWDHYAIGYEKKDRSCGIYKILRFYDDWGTYFLCEIYVSKTNSWHVIPNMTLPEWCLFRCSVSLKGNTYWIATDRTGRFDEDILFLICFDFTKERFGPRLSLPLKCNLGTSVDLSSVREEQLVVLIQKRFTCVMEIWVTSNIEPKTVSWSKLFLSVDMTLISPFNSHGSRISVGDVVFFIDEKKKIVVIVDKNEDCRYNVAYIIGEDGYITQVDLGKVKGGYCRSSYIHIKKPRRKQLIF